MRKRGGSWLAGIDFTTSSPGMSVFSKASCMYPNLFQTMCVESGVTLRLQSLLTQWWQFLSKKSGLRNVKPNFSPTVTVRQSHTSLCLCILVKETEVICMQWCHIEWVKQNSALRSWAIFYWYGPQWRGRLLPHQAALSWLESVGIFFLGSLLAVNDKKKKDA